MDILSINNWKTTMEIWFQKDKKLEIYLKDIQEIYIVYNCI